MAVRTGDVRNTPKIPNRSAIRNSKATHPRACKACMHWRPEKPNVCKMRKRRNTAARKYCGDCLKLKVLCMFFPMCAPANIPRV